MKLLIASLVMMLTVFPATALEFFDDFEDGNLDGWECADDCGNWFVSCAHPEGTAFCLLPFEPQLSSSIYPASMEWSDLQIDLDLRGIVGNDKIIHFRVSAEGNVYYGLNLRAEVNDIGFGKKAEPDGPWTTLVQVPCVNENGTWHHLTIRAVGGQIEVWVDGVEYIDYVDPDPLPAGEVWLCGYSAGSPTSIIQWDNVSIEGEGSTSGILEGDSIELSTWGQIKTRQR